MRGLAHAAVLAGPGAPFGAGDHSMPSDEGGRQSGPQVNEPFTMTVESGICARVICVAGRCTTPGRAAF